LQATRKVKTLLKKDLILGQEYMAFLLLNVFDLLLTGWIFKHNGMEANGLAAFILNNFGQHGDSVFAIYKFLMVVVVIVICEIIASKSIAKAKLIMLLGCVVYFGVVLYESYLIYQFIGIQSLGSTSDSSIISCFQSLMLGRS
jgi:hypothetical protein